MLTLLLACAPSLHSATANEGSGATLKELNVEVRSTGQWIAEMDEPGPVIVACESDQGSVTYGPSDDPTIVLRWSPTLLAYTISSIESADCRLWLIK